MASEESKQQFRRALSLIKVEQIFEAVPLLNQVIEAEPAWAEPYVQRARVRKRLGDLEKAITDYSKALKLAPKAETYLGRALVWLALDQFKGAIADSRQAVAIEPEFAGGHQVLGKALGLFGDGPGAIAAYKQAARCYLNDKDKVNAKKCVDAIEPLKQLPAFGSAQASGMAVRKGVESSSELVAVTTPEAFVEQLRSRYEKGEYAATLEHLNWLLSVHPNHARALCLRGLVQARLGRRQQAVEDLALAAQQNPEDAEVRFCRGQMRQILGDDYGAVEEFSALIESAEAEADQELSAKYFAARGDSYRLMEETEQAFKDYSNAIAIDTENPLLYELRAEVQKNMSSRDGAIEDYQKAATLWLNRGNWQKHQRVVDEVRSLRKQKSTSPATASKTGSTVPVKSFENHLPVVEVLLDGVAKFDVVIDRNAPNSIITKQMASQLQLPLVSYQYVYLADGTPMELSIAKLRSVMVGETIVTDVYVAVAPDNATVVLGKDCFSAYSIRMSGNEITFARR
ncbi:MAG: tetratricopeptide repeat protein, partial [Cyanobacteria bacterium J06555_13]